MPTSIVRANHLCAALRLRLNLPRDPCGLDLDIDTQRDAIQFQVASNLPTDTYGRGQVLAAPGTGSNLFTRAASEALCTGVANTVVDSTTAPAAPGRFGLWQTSPAGAAVTFSSTDVPKAVNDMVRLVMGLSQTDPRASDMRTMLLGHYQQAMGVKGVNKTDALRSAFVLACLSPPSLLLGL